MAKKKTISKNQKNKGVLFLFIFIAIIMFPLGHHVSGYRAMEIAEEQVTILINDPTVQVEALSYDLHHELYRVYLNLTQGQINQETEIHVTRDGTALIMGEIKHINEGAESNKLEEKINVELSENELSIGDINAPVTLVEWSDFQCPYCKKFYEDTIKDIKTNYIDTGKVRFVYKHFPLSFHEAAEISAQAVECANEQGVWYEYHAAIFENQNGAYGKSELIRWSQGIVEDQNEFRSCLNSNRYAEKVKNDMSYGQSIGVQGTPGSFVNGIKVDGAQPYNVLASLIESELRN